MALHNIKRLIIKKGDCEITYLKTDIVYYEQYAHGAVPSPQAYDEKHLVLVGKAPQ